MILPMLVIATVVILQFAVAVVVKQAVSHAATVAAREAGKGADMEELVDAVDTVLRIHGITVGPHASVVLEDPEASEPVQQRGDVDCPPLAEPSLDPDEVRVTVCVELCGPPLLGALCPFGITFVGKHIRVRSVVTKEDSP
jgi:hypothetical protein